MTVIILQVKRSGLWTDGVGEVLIEEIRLDWPLTTVTAALTFSTVMFGMLSVGC